MNLVIFTVARLSEVKKKTSGESQFCWHNDKILVLWTNLLMLQMKSMNFFYDLSGHVFLYKEITFVVLARMSPFVLGP